IGMLNSDNDLRKFCYILRSQMMNKIFSRFGEMIVSRRRPEFHSLFTVKGEGFIGLPFDDFKILPVKTILGNQIFQKNFFHNSFITVRSHNGIKSTLGESTERNED